MPEWVGSTACSTPTTMPTTRTGSTICAWCRSTVTAGSTCIMTRSPASSSDRGSAIASTRRRGANIRRSSRAMKSVPASWSKSRGSGVRIQALPFRQIHGQGETLGFRFGGIAYSPDVNDLPDETLEALRDLDVWILDALRYTPHPSHFSVEQALSFIARVKTEARGAHPYACRSRLRDVEARAAGGRRARL